jgi:Na+-transporting methylmalonyl-CoA/oxaloacetate decarboxylase gamma subunit
MQELINQSLLITGIGMGLVFLVILFLWGLMELLVKSMQDKPKPLSKETVAALDDHDIPKSEDHKQLAAALAVSAALMQRAASLKIQAASQPTSRTSNWQSVLRAAQRSQHSRLFFRK